jgi:outer membrane lipoprotein SlyB
MRTRKVWEPYPQSTAKFVRFFGQHGGKDLTAITGAVGCAVAGNQIEKSVKKKVEYDVLVRLEDNTAQTIHYQSDPGFRGGERVKVVVAGQIQRL